MTPTKRRPAAHEGEPEMPLKLTDELRALEPVFRREEEAWAKAGSGMTRDQMTGATMAFAWLQSPQGGGLRLAHVQRALDAAAAEPVR